MLFKNTHKNFGLISISLHWTMAIMIICLLIFGLYMVALPFSLQKLKYYGWHKEFGFLVLYLALARLIWRFINISPELKLNSFEKFAARLVHLCFYLMMFAMPITGWLVTSSAGLPASFFGLITMPDLVKPNAELRHLFSLAHQWLAYGLIGLILMHSSAALKHHFIDKDNILRRMLSWK